MEFKKKEIIGMIHLAGPDAVAKALEEIDIYVQEGLSGIIIENYHGSVSEVRQVLSKLTFNLPLIEIGINILPNEFEEAFALAQQFPIVSFIQLDYIAGAYGFENKPTMLDADKFIEVAMNTRPVKVYGGVWPKYYHPVKDSILSVDIFDAIFLGQGIVVTGSGTGSETPLDKVKQFNGLIKGEVPLIVGAGLTPENVKEQLQYADGGIVGSAFKPNGRTQQMVDRDLVREFMNAVKEI
jgi:predicted TIM-barrel enzyme